MSCVISHSEATLSTLNHLEISGWQYFAEALKRDE
jgi:hypothetical protein